MKTFEIIKANKSTINTCVCCGKEFIAFRKHKKYCSCSCKQKSYINRLKNKKIEITINLQCPKSWIARLLSWFESEEHKAKS